MASLIFNALSRFLFLISQSKLLRYTCEVLFVVLQGSVIGPNFLIIYINYLCVTLANVLLKMPNWILQSTLAMILILCN